jgi:hypothetical protein
MFKCICLICARQFKRLNPVRAAAYDSTRRESCFKGTRTQLLCEIQSWMKNGGGKHVYLLYGVAGIGKSTVAKTAAEYAANDKTLGASFFFSRDEDNRKTAKSLFTTLAYHLAYHYPVIAERINKVLEGDPEVVERDPIQQFDRLIARPLQAPIDSENPIILIIDALDECEENDAETVLSLLAQEVPRIVQLRVFITARPEPHIRSIFVQDRNHHQFHLHDIDRTIVSNSDCLRSKCGERFLIFDLLFGSQRKSKWEYLLACPESFSSLLLPRLLSFLTVNTQTPHGG